MNDDDIDAAAFDLFKLNTVERILINDFLDITLRDFKETTASPGQKPIFTQMDKKSEKIEDYCRWPIVKRLEWLYEANRLRNLLPPEIIKIQEAFRKGESV